MRIFLAPMEGVVDVHMRQLLSAIGGIDICVTEFIRVTDHILPDKVFHRRCPELLQNSRTPSGVPVRVQLLGGKPEPVALNASVAARLGASAIDLNFGCPAKTVNKSDGGACLLKDPERLNTIVSATRQQVPSSTPVTAKIRLGFDDRSRYLDNALAAFEGGANELVVHARSKADGYRPPAYWEYIAEIRETISIPVIANGEIWSVDDYIRCRSVTGCDDVMIGRGLLSCPDLARQIKAYQQQTDMPVMGWDELCRLLLHFFETTADAYPEKYMGNRLKQWLHYLCRQYPQATTLFENIKRCRDRRTITEALQAQIQHRTQQAQRESIDLDNKKAAIA
jgi:tRNA-dihydrouridine synthase C